MALEAKQQQQKEKQQQQAKLQQLEQQQAAAQQQQQAKLQELECELTAMKEQHAKKSSSIQSAAQLRTKIMQSSDWAAKESHILGQELEQSCVRSVAAVKEELLKELESAQCTTLEALAAAERRERLKGRPPAPVNPQPPRKRARTAQDKQPQDPSSSTSDSSAAEAAGELKVQLAVGYLLRVLKRKFPEVQWQQHDTSESGVDGQKGKVDWVFSRPEVLHLPQPGWAQVVFMMQLKPLLKGAGTAQAVGQLKARATQVFGHQLKARQFILALALGADAAMLLKLWKVGAPQHTPPMPFSISRDSEGFHLLLQLLLSKLAVHHYPVVAPPRIPQVSEPLLVVLQPADANAVREQQHRTGHLRCGRQHISMQMAIAHRWLSRSALLMRLRMR